MSEAAATTTKFSSSRDVLFAVAATPASAVLSPRCYYRHLLVVVIAATSPSHPSIHPRFHLHDLDCCRLRRAASTFTSSSLWLEILIKSFNMNFCTLLVREVFYSRNHSIWFKLDKVHLIYDCIGEGHNLIIWSMNWRNDQFDLCAPFKREQWRRRRSERKARKELIQKGTRIIWVGELYSKFSSTVPFRSQSVFTSGLFQLPD